ncbi:MAG: bifunctional aspartate kinase/homoserine dehydrogenase I, partial [Rikenellaceae bacterium]
VVAYNRSIILDNISRKIDDLSNILKGVFLIGDLSQKTNNVIVSYGERLSSLIVSGAIEGLEHYDALSFIKTTPYHNKHVVNFDETVKAVKTALKGKKAIVGGFISTDAATGDITNLGRGGSDYTASIIAASLGASLLEIWTDVDGFMTADPRVIPHAYPIPELSFLEAMELCNFGAKVIYPPTIYPAYHKNIPIKIKNTFNPSAPGTTITNKVTPNTEALIKGISSINDTSLITIQGLGMVGVIGVNYRIFKALAKNGVSVFFVSQAASENNTSIGVSSCDADYAVEILEREFEGEIQRGEINRIQLKNNLATVAIVGESMKETPGIVGKLFGTMGRNGINIIACAQGAGETNVSFIVKIENLQKTLSLIHDSFFLSECQVFNIFIAGVGLVGGNLLDQIKQQQLKLKEENSLDIRIVGISNSRRYIFAEEGLDLSTYREQLQVSEQNSTPAIYSEKIISTNLFNSVFVDCTANATVASVYEQLLSHNISVVAANKVAASSDYEHYHRLKELARRKGVKYLFETNVGAGLPIISTINGLMKSGDKIHKIEAVVSGTLNYLFNEMSESVPLSKAVRMAMEAGYAEPDPRLDLSGMDVIRKLVILSREAGYKVEIDDVKKDLFLPDHFFDGSTDDFWALLPSIDAQFEERRKELVREGKRWRFVALMDRGKFSVSLREVDSTTP